MEKCGLGSAAVEFAKFFAAYSSAVVVGVGLPAA